MPSIADLFWRAAVSSGSSTPRLSGRRAGCSEDSYGVRYLTGGGRLRGPTLRAMAEWILGPASLLARRSVAADPLFGGVDAPAPNDLFAQERVSGIGWVSDGLHICG